jgi:hypothetical protein
VKTTGNRLRRRHHRLGGRGRDRDDHVRVLAGEFLGDLRRRRRGTLRRLIAEGEVGAVLVAGLLQRLLDAVAGSVERRVLDDGGDRDRHLLGLLGDGCCAGQKRQGKTAADHGCAQTHGFLSIRCRAGLPRAICGGWQSP